MGTQHSQSSIEVLKEVIKKDKYQTFVSFITKNYNKFIKLTINQSDIIQSEILNKHQTIRYLFCFLINKLFKKT